MVTEGIVDLTLDDDEFVEDYDWNGDLEESSFPTQARQLFAGRKPPYYRPGPPRHGTLSAPGAAPVPIRSNFVTAPQLDIALKKVRNDVLQLASAIKGIKAKEGGGINDVLPFLLMGGQSKPEIEKISFSNNNAEPFDTANEVNVSSTTYKPQKSNMGLILALMLSTGKDQSNMGMITALAISGVFQ